MNKGRRTFIKRTGGVTLLIGGAGIIPHLISCSDNRETISNAPATQLTAWVRLDPSGSLTIYNPAAEMGQGSMTSLPLIFTEEMDADWNKVNVEFSPQESAIYGSDGWSSDRKVMLSAGSRITKGYFQIMRKAGAQARHIMLYSASELWDMPIESLTTENGLVIDEKGDKKISYGELVEHLQLPDPLPEIDEIQLKDPKYFRLIGKDIPRIDIPQKVNGTAQFAIDIKLPEMLYGVIERGRVHGAHPTLLNEEAIKALPGIQKIVLLDYGVGIVAQTLEEALGAKQELRIQWSEALASGFNSQKVFETYAAKADNEEEHDIITNQGNTNEVFRKAVKRYQVDFKNDYVYHAQMEPLNAIVRVSEDGQRAEAWVGSQQGFDSKLGLPGALDLEPDNIDIHLQYLGGGLGRRSMTDFVVECGLLAKEVPGYPVKLLWTREDDLTYGAYRPLSLQRLKVGIDKEGDISSFAHIVVGDGNRLLASGIKNAFYNIPNQYAALNIIPAGVRLKHWRAVGHGPNKYAIESMLDIIARDQGIDPVEIRRKLMHNSPKALATLNKAAEMADWNEESTVGRAKGVAFLERSGTLSTGICEISVDRATGKIRVHRFWSAHDAGIVIQPDNVRAQIEGGIIMGVSSVLKEQLTIVDGRVVQSNFHDYHLLRMGDTPELIETAIIPSAQPPEGVGESGTPLVAGAIANAFLALTGKHLDHLPFTPERVLRALNG
ncbi:MAG: xanthine dehydrogenase family protein molybdopterin-binding subunit [Saprospiraceae bacterium]|nr:xanthine dehydrogenase family protein molybdopterin-binding subunit [Saprospiraceae bacterium]